MITALTALLLLSAPPAEIALDDVLVHDPAGRYGRAPVHLDAIQEALIAGTWSSPAAGADGWTAATARDGSLQGLPALRGGWVHWTVTLDEPAVYLLDARGQSVTYVNGEPRVGNPYSWGSIRVPVALAAGDNELLFQVSRGGLSARMTTPRAPVSFGHDWTLPQVITGEDGGVPGGVPIVNATGERLEDLIVRIGGFGVPTRETRVPAIEPWTVRKVPVWFGGPLPRGVRECEVRLQLLDDGGARLDERTVRLSSRRPDERHVRTFVSAIDGSVQYYAVVPAQPEDGDATPGLILTLHGAGVEGSGQAAVYGPRPWAHVVAPTNRRSFGFDWEDWGRLDAMEVLEHASALLEPDPRRTWLTGHSMGGHGTWHVGATFPDRFGAIAPSAGWVSFWSYTGAREAAADDPVDQLMRRAVNASDTRRLARNHLQHGVYILHGARDDNVPADQSRAMNELLGSFHPDFVYHEQPDAGHWWGNQCCDWPDLMAFLEARPRREAGEIDRVEFVTASPGVSASSGWVTIAQQHESMAFSRVEIDRDRVARSFTGTSGNVRRLALDLSALDAGVSIEVMLDGATVDVPWPDGAPVVWLERVEPDGPWARLEAAPPASDKGPHRAGPFKDVFRHRVVLVYGTAGDDDEDAWARRKARYDAETFWYRGNGAFDVVADVDFDPAAYRDRNVVLYGNADTNAAWETLLGDSPVRIERGRIRVGNDDFEGDDLACLLIRPRPGSDNACVGVVGGTGPAGLRRTDRLPYFVSGVAYPDVTIIGPAPTPGEMVRLAAFFGPDWSLETGQRADRGVR